jgi:hypothetical protein
MARGHCQKQNAEDECGPHNSSFAEGRWNGEIKVGGLQRRQAETDLSGFTGWIPPRTDHFRLFHAKILLILSKNLTTQALAAQGFKPVFAKNHNFFKNSFKNLLTI